MMAEKINRLDSICEFKYAEGCQYIWPYNLEDNVDYRSLVNSGWLYDSFKSFLEGNDIFELKFYDEFDSDDEEFESNNQELDEDRKRLLAAKLETWAFTDIVCSCLFYTLSNQIKKHGDISYVTWEHIVLHLTSPLIGPELLAVIKRNGFFELNPKQAIEATSSFFRDEFLHYHLSNKPGIESNILRVLECIQVDPKIAQELTTETLKTEDFSFILTFLENYSFPKARRISQQQLESFLKCLQLTAEEKSTLAQDAKDKLENSDKSWSNLLSSWDDFSLPMILNIDSYQEDLIAEETKKSAIWTKETYLALAKLKAVINAAGKENLSLVTYPPISLVEKYLKTNESKLNSSIIKLLFLPEKGKQKNLAPTSLSPSLIYTLVAFFVILWSGGFNVGLARRNTSQFASIRFGSMPVSARLVERDQVFERVQPVINNSLDKVKIINKQQLTSSQSQQSRSSKVIIDSKTNLKVSTYDKGYLLTGNTDSYYKLKTKIKNIQSSNMYGLSHPGVKEEIDHLLMAEQRRALELSYEYGRDESTSIIVPAFVNKNRTCISSKAFTRSVSYEQAPDFVEYTKSEIESSVNNLSPTTFRGSHQSTSWAAFQEMSTLDQVKQSYNPAINRLTNELDDKVIKRHGIKNSLHAFLIQDARVLHARWAKHNQNMLNPSTFPTNFNNLDRMVLKELQFIKEQLRLSKSLISHLHPDRPMTIRLITEQNMLAGNTLCYCQYMFNMYPSVNKEQGAFSLKNKITEMEARIHSRVSVISAPLSDLKELNTAMEDAGYHSRYPKTKWS